ncbi:hypothetical protein QVD17_10397 [Tagetes erecta]|uniref:non-specific serine/threonine protein kinase n=1 Tax=Tagetes erecta TaxID=13708 RepID=A0AAD8P663_TARER|nr:hypothetical protein QVD17_10397 [Tagetes erecta]
MDAKTTTKPDQRFNLEPDVSVSSLVTRQKAAAAKQLIENHYKNYLQGLQDRKERRRALQRRAAEAQVSSEEEEQMLRNLEKKETKYMRLQRHKIGIDDFELLTLIGKGAFGEVIYDCLSFYEQNVLTVSLIVRLCRAKTNGEVFAMKKLKISDMLSRGLVEHVRSERNLLVEVDSCYILSEDVARFYMAESILAINSIHQHNYIHRKNCNSGNVIDVPWHFLQLELSIIWHPKCC